MVLYGSLVWADVDLVLRVHGFFFIVKARMAEGFTGWIGGRVVGLCFFRSRCTGFREMGRIGISLASSEGDSFRWLQGGVGIARSVMKARHEYTFSRVSISK